jgi:hypothetical protein
MRTADDESTSVERMDISDDVAIDVDALERECRTF